MSKLLKEGHRVKVVSLDIKGTIFYISYGMIQHSHTYPIQVELDKAYDDSGQTMYRTSVDDLRKLRKKRHI